jgi:hypothetical protein
MSDEDPEGAKGGKEVVGAAAHPLDVLYGHDRGSYG